MKLRFAFVFAFLAAPHLFAANPGKAGVDEVKRYGSDQVMPYDVIWRRA